MRYARGQSIIELLLAMALFSLLLPAILTGLVNAREGRANRDLRDQATRLAAEALEAARSVEERGWASFAVDGNYHPVLNGSAWQLAVAPEDIEGFSRQLKISSVRRDAANVIVEAGGSADPDSKKVEAIVSWHGGTDSLTLSTYLTNHRSSRSSGGMLVYGDGGTSSDLLRYRLYDNFNSVWAAPVAAADVDPATTNKVPRVVRVFSSAIRQEKVLLSKHVAGNNQFIYAQVFDGTNWGNVVQLSTWNSTSFQNMPQFSGTYLANGDFMAVFSDNSHTPKARIWNGSTWSAAHALRTVNSTPVQIIVKARPGSNEAMAVAITQGRDMYTQYFNGGGYVSGNWSSTRQVNNGPYNDREMVDFTWSQANPLKGAFVYTGHRLESKATVSLWTADGNGGGSWGNESSAPSQGVIGALSITSQASAEEYMVCDQDNNREIRCYAVNGAGVWSTPANNILASNITGPPVQKVFDMKFGLSSSQKGVAVFLDGTNQPRLKQYQTSTASFEAGGFNINGLSGNFTGVRILPQPGSDDHLILMSDSSRRLYSVFWDNYDACLYTAPADKALLTQGVSGSDATSYWYDFTWN